ncbi:hypothetical protein CI109_106529 [Kwoniella shandongensis]|uniref:Uncharacterized protein n=1 Tax=Kwoniella shandongensis TaxID=1734106 RepID=A0A5M6C1U0_9TREE|nr:uncharacterized protein CI109_002710 [Kwoniella shandongensis]KAA5528953.1 hypothetical protein CI109_002710 [Kwoniella shandongensis]
MADPLSQEEFTSSLTRIVSHLQNRHTDLSHLPVLPTSSSISDAISSLPPTLPAQGLGTSETISYLLSSLLPGVLQAQNGPRYFGFVVGGVTPAAQLADILAGSYDENVQVTLSEETISTAVEQRALEMVLDLIDIPRNTFMGRTITTGATGSNILGLACARDYLYAHSPHLPTGYSYAQDGPPSSPTLPSPPIIILSLHPHFSIAKAASLVGLGSSSTIIHQLPAAEDDELAFDLSALEARLKVEKEVGRGVIVVYGAGEVNTGGFGSGLGDVARLSKQYGAWLHVDAAFGGFAGLMPELAPYTKDMDKADSLTLDGHKWLQVPYDCGIFYTRHVSSLTNVFQPPSASAPAYLSAGKPSAGVEANDGATVFPEGTVQAREVTSPLYVGAENSRRFRALPLIASMISLGKEGYRDIIVRNITFARRIATFISQSPYYELLNPTPPSFQVDAVIPSNIVLFRSTSSSPFSPDDPTSSARLVKAINGSRKMYVSGTKWRGVGAVRIAVSNWRTGVEGEGDWEIVKDVLENVGKGEEVKWEG